MLPANPETNKSVVTETNDDSHVVAGMMEHFSGPLPHPQTLEQYDKIVPGAAERIIRKFESQTEHRQKIEDRFVWAESIKSVGGLIGGFIIAMTVIVGGIYTAIRNPEHPFLGGALSFTGLAAIVFAFITEKYRGNGDGDDE